MRVLIIEDDIVFADTLRNILSSNFNVDISHTGEDGCLMAYSENYNLFIIDLHLPDIDGREVCRIIKGVNPSIPIIFITGETKIPFKVSSLDSGADDYITKPFREPELMARIRAVLRRTKDLPPEGNSLRYKELEIDLKNKTCMYRNKQIPLSKKEFEILTILVRNPNKIVNRERLISAVWQRYEDLESNVLDVHISKLRRKLPKTLEIKTIYSNGYSIN